MQAIQRRSEVLAAAPTSEVAGKTAEVAAVLKALGDPTRLAIAALLARGLEPLCVCHVEARFSLSQPTISHHLRVLREAMLVRSEKRGTWVYYALERERVAQIVGLAQMLESVAPRARRGRVLPVSARAIVAEALGTAMLLAIVVGSGIMGEALSGGNVAIALLANSIATGTGLAVLIAVLAPISGAHFNPIVSVMESARGAMSGREAALRVAAQLGGALAGVIVAHVMFAHAPIAISSHERSGLGQLAGEAVATFGLVGVVTVLPRRRPEATAVAVGAYITSAYWFTSSTSFANPAVTLARALTDTFTGIRPEDVGPFIAAQIVGAALGAALFGWLAPLTFAASGDRGSSNDQGAR